jgi:DNA-binding NarL/FixJ family response regulator
LQALATGLYLLARYDEALETAMLELEEGRRNGLAFVLPHAFCNCSIAHLGLKNLRNAGGFVKSAEKAATDVYDNHVLLQTRVLQARILLAQRKPDAALTYVPPPSWDKQPIRGMRGDYLGTRAIALACNGDLRGASSAAEEARAASRDAEARVLSTFALAIAAYQRGHGTAEAAEAALREMLDTGNRDSAVVAYRAFPQMMPTLLRDEKYGADMRQLIVSVGDTGLARKQGVELENGAERLTPRESEVLELLKGGMKTHEIARSLWITEGTVKVHVRHIRAKLNAKTRAEAVARSVSYAESEKAKAPSARN